MLILSEFMNDNTIRVNIENNSPRKEYAIRQVIENIIGGECIFVEDAGSAQEGAMINYSRNRVEGAINIMPAGLLDDSAAIVTHPEAGQQWHDTPTLFPTTGGDIPFDIFSAAFFMLTRMEEYDSCECDIHGRYVAEKSTAYRHGFLHRPVVDEWAMLLAELIKERFPQFSYRKKETVFVSTIDIDHPFKYRNKGLIKNAGGLVRDIATGNTAAIPERLAVITRLRKDPYSCFDYLDNVYRRNGCCPIFFIMMCKRGRYDRKYLYPSSSYHRTLKQFCQKYFMGLHPSYRAAFDASLIQAEKQKLERIIGEKVDRVRFHYLRMKLPQSYRLLEQAGLHHDYTMMYSSQAGFRAGTSIPYRYFDAQQNRLTDITVHPSCIMDVTLKNSHKLSREEALAMIRSMHYSVDRCGGEFITLFHNSSLGEDTEWKGWRKTFEQMFTYLW